MLDWARSPHTGSLGLAGRLLLPRWLGLLFRHLHPSMRYKPELPPLGFRDTHISLCLQGLVLGTGWPPLPEALTLERVTGHPAQPSGSAGKSQKTQCQQVARPGQIPGRGKQVCSQMEGGHARQKGGPGGLVSKNNSLESSLTGSRRGVPPGSSSTRVTHMDKAPP